MSSERRAALIEWAELGDRLIIEDDYDAELCRDRIGQSRDLPPTASSTSGRRASGWPPACGSGWMIPPSWLSWALISAKAIEDAGSEIAGQLALADFIARGELERHSDGCACAMPNACRPCWTRWRRHCPTGTPDPRRRPACARRPAPDSDEPACSRRRTPRRRGRGALAAQLLGDCPPGLVLGYAQMADPAIARGVALLSDALSPTALRASQPTGTVLDPLEHEDTAQDRQRRRIGGVHPEITEATRAEGSGLGERGVGGA